MSTIAAALQLPASPAPLEASAVPSTPLATTTLASDDFVLALTQALSVAAPTPALAQAIAAIVPEGVVDAAPAEPLPEEPSAEELAASFAGMLSLPLMPPPNNAPVAADAADPLELLGVSNSASRAEAPAELPLAVKLSSIFTNAATQEPQDKLAADVPVPQAEDALLLAPSVERAPRAASPLHEAPAAARPLQSNVGTPAWTEELGTRVTVMAERGQHSASLRLAPEHLGPLEIRIAIRDDQASVWFGAAHADTRAAIEHALPRLREMFAAQGMSLADAGVSREPPREQPAQPRPTSRFGDTASETPVTIATVQRAGLIDAYA